MCLSDSKYRAHSYFKASSSKYWMPRSVWFLFNVFLKWLNSTWINGWSSHNSIFNQACWINVELLQIWMVVSKLYVRVVKARGCPLKACRNWQCNEWFGKIPTTFCHSEGCQGNYSKPLQLVAAIVTFPYEYQDPVHTQRDAIWLHSIILYRNKGIFGSGKHS